MGDDFSIDQNELNNLLSGELAAAPAPAATPPPPPSPPPAPAAVPPPPPVQTTAPNLNAFSDSTNSGNSDISLIEDIPVEVAVELGRTTKHVSEILKLGPGSVIELDRLVGETVDLLANGRLIGKGEVVVVDENFGLRLTEVIKKAKN
jgi:flagellar motor switch protein FliN